MADDMKISTVALELRPSPFGNLLPSPREVDLGTPVEEALISVKGLEVRLGDKPIARDLRRLYHSGHQQLPPQLAVFDAYDIWMIQHTVAVIRREGSAKVLALGYIADFGDAERVYTVDLMPQSQFSTTFEGSLKARFALGAEGRAGVPEKLKPVLEALEVVGGDAKLELSAAAGLIGNVSLSLISPLIQTVGTGSSQCEWCFQVEKNPLLGEQTMLQTILVPKFTQQVRFRIRGYALIRASWISFPARFETDWMDVQCRLE